MKKIWKRAGLRPSSTDALRNDPIRSQEGEAWAELVRIDPAQSHGPSASVWRSPSGSVHLTRRGPPIGTGAGCELWSAIERLAPHRVRMWDLPAAARRST